MMDESRHVAVTGSAQKHSVQLTFSVSHPWRLRTEFDDGTTWEVEDHDLFQCLGQIRNRLESEGALIWCESAQKDVFPSGMARQMGGARRAYRLVSDRSTGAPTLVDIFAATNCEAAATASQQFESAMRLLRG
jgi:hypothetical protein